VYYHLTRWYQSIRPRHCDFIAPATSLLLTINNNDPLFGDRFNLSVAPVDSTAQRAAYLDEDLTLALSELPHAGSVGEFGSRYEVTGLIPERYYLVKLLEPSGDPKLETANGGLYLEQCEVRVTPGGGSCLASASTEGTLDVRVGAGKNTLFPLVLSDPLTERGDFVSTDTPLAITTNTATATPISSEIQVSAAVSMGHPVVTILTEQIRNLSGLKFVLEAPDGQQFTLAGDTRAANTGRTVYTDLANYDSSADYAHAAISNTTYRPEQAFFHRLQGISASGTWKLLVSHSGATAGGNAIATTLVGWGISFDSP